MRALALYLRSRRAAPTLTAVAGLVAALWTVGRAVDGAGVLGLLAVVAGLAMVGPGLAGPDTDLDRTAAVAWPPRRAAHLTVAVTAVALLVAAAGLGGDGRLIRDAAGLGGLLGLGAATLGAQRAWLVPMTWTLVGSVVLGPVWREPTPAQSALAWMVQPSGTRAAAGTATALATAGLLLYALRGPARTSRA